MDPSRQLSPRISVSPQIGVADVAALAAAGVDLIVCNRPDREDAGQPDADDLMSEASRLGLRFVHMPVVGRPTPEQAVALEDVLGGSARAHLYCRSGMRSAALWAMAEVLGGRDPTEAEAAAAGAGYDLSGLGLATLSGSPRS